MKNLSPQAIKNRSVKDYLEEDFLTHGHYLQHLDSDDLLFIDRDESEFGESAECLLLFMKILKSPKSPIYCHTPVQDRKGRIHIQLTRIGSRLQRCLAVLHLVKAHRSRYDFHPSVEAFMQAVDSLPRVQEQDHHLSRPERDARQLQALLDDLHVRANSKELLNAVAAKQRNKNAVFSRLRMLVEMHLQRTASILICRLDLHYPPQSRHENFDTAHNPDQVSAEIQALLKYTKKKYPGYLAYIVRLEYGHSRGLHAHVAFLFNASIHQQDISISQDLGMFWKNDVTSGKGSFYNCNLSKPLYTHLGIGKINYSDTNKEIGVMKMLVYLCKPDLYFPSSPSWRKMRRIRKSDLPGPLPVGQKKKGRPRHRTNGLRLSGSMPFLGTN